MSVLQALILGVVQGLTEFLPISSSGHLVLVPAMLGWELPPPEFDVMLHSASMVALLVYLRREVVEIVGGLLAPGRGRRLLLLLVVGTIPAALVGFVFEERLSSFFERPRAVSGFLIVTGVMLVVAETYSRRRSHASTNLEGLNAGGAVGIGLAQAFAILPGISRSGATIAAGMGFGMDRAGAARFSFLLAIPILIGVSVYELPELQGAGISAGALVAGGLASLVTSYLAIAGMIAYLRRRGLYPFAAYCLVVGTATALVL